MKSIEEIQAGMPKAHPGIEEWIYTFCAKGTYIIYEKKTGKAVCTRCGKEFKAEDYFRHNDLSECPCCGSSAELKASGIGRAYTEEKFRILELSHKGKTVWACAWKIMLDFSSFGRPEIKKSLDDVYTINEKEQHHFAKTWDWVTGRSGFIESASMKLGHMSGGYIYGYKEPPFENVFIYRKNLENVFLKSSMKYLWDENFISTMSAFQLIRYMSCGMKWQSVELLLKAGFTNLIRDRISQDPYGSGCVNWRGKSLQSILRLPMRDIRYIREKNPGFTALGVFNTFPEEIRRKIPHEDLFGIANYIYPGDWTMKRGTKAYIRRVTDYLPLSTWIDYKNKQGQKKKISINDYADYIDAAMKLGLDLRRKKVMLPEDFWPAHDEVMERYADLKVEINNKKILDIDKKVKFENDELTVIVATKQSQLNAESAGLHHCVRTYGEKLAEGRCMIFFIRKKDEVEKPYFTLETSPAGDFVQCRGAGNCGMPQDVRLFVNEFIAYLWKILRRQVGRNAA